jgi:glycosyltransferase involved in cell wall biosynthesis
VGAVLGRGRPRVCMVVHGPYPVGEERVLREARALVAHGYDVDIVAMRQPGEVAEELVDGCRVFRLPVAGGPRTRSRVVYEYLAFLLLAGGRLLRSLMRPYSVVQIHNPPDFLLAAGLLPRLRGSRLVFDVHDFAPELFLLHFQRAPKLLVRSLFAIERWAFRRADLVLTVNESYRRRIAEKRGGDSGVAVVLNSLDEGLLPDRPAPARDDTFRVVTHGTLNRHYGVEVLVEAFATLRERHPNARLEIYGDGDAVPLIRRRISELGVEPVTTFEGRYLPQREALELVLGASVGVVANLGHPRNHAALPVKLLEYVAMGIPVVTSDLRAIRDYFAEDELAFYPPGDSEALAAELLAVATDPQAASARAERARGRYRDYRWSVQADRYVSLLDSLIGRRRKDADEAG